MPGNYTCVNCGHEGYTHGSPIWVQRCDICDAPVGKKIGEGKMVRTTDGIKFRKYVDNFSPNWNTVFGIRKAQEIAEKVRKSGFRVRIIPIRDKFSIKHPQYAGYNVWISIKGRKKAHYI